jgi:hypothetical protein
MELRLLYCLRAAGNVLAVDGESAGIKWLMDKVPQAAQVRAMIGKFETEYFTSRMRMVMAASDPKHWHVFTIIVWKISD